jgi:hypothetical protein
MPLRKDRRSSGMNQSRARKKKFSHDQYWSLAYTEVHEDPPERDYRTIIKARSAALAREILESRLQENKGFKKIRSVTYSLIHASWLRNALGKKLSIVEWASIRHVSFPNDWNRLFKFEKKRIKGQTNRFNVPPTVLTPAHKKKLRKAVRTLVDKYIRGSFKPMCPALQEECNKADYKAKSGYRTGFVSLQDKRQASQELAYLKKLMKQCGGNIKYCADKMKIGRSSFYRALMRFPKVDWHKEFPLTYVRTPATNSMDKPGAREKLSQTLKAMGHCPPPNRKGTKSYNKWKKKIITTWRKKQRENLDRWKPKLIEALRKFDHKRTESAEMLGISASHMLRLMHIFRSEDRAFNKEFWDPEISMRLKEAACRRTRKETRLNYLKKNKHLILQAYYQNGEADSKAAKVMKMDTRTFTKAREEIEQYEV